MLRLIERGIFNKKLIQSCTLSIMQLEAAPFDCCLFLTPTRKCFWKVTGACRTYLARSIMNHALRNKALYKEL